MGKTNRGRNIILAAVTSILCGSAALTAYASNVNGETGIFVKQETEQEKPVLPVAEEKMMFGRKYTLDEKTSGGAGIYTNAENDRARDYVVDALNEAEIDNRMNDLDKIQAINNYLCEKLEYADYATEEGFSYKEDWLPFTDYCLMADSAVCAGYAEAFQSMCIACGIECYYVTGYTYQGDDTEGVYHAWNRVVTGERSYYIDTCWNDSSNDAYFLSANGWDDHEIDKEHETYRISGQAFPMPEYIAN